MSTSETEVADPPELPARRLSRASRWWASRWWAGRGIHGWAWPAGFAVAAVVLFLCYLQQSRTAPVNSDGASNALQAWDMLHGNLLLRSWSVSDVSFYTTELPQYMLVEAIRGLNSDVVHVAGAMTYTLLVLLAALLAKGRATGRESLVRVLLAGGIMLAPQLGNATYTLMLSPDHVGTGVPVLLTWLVIDRAPRRWYVPVVVGVLLAWAQIADALVLVIGIAPVAAVYAMRAYQGLVQRRESLISQWYEISMAAAAVISVKVASSVVQLIASHGGYTVNPLKTTFAGIDTMTQHFWLTFEGLLELFGADFFGMHLGRDAIFALVHLAGFALFAWALWLAVRRFFHQDLLVQLLTVAIFVNVAAYVFGVQVGDIRSTREISAVLPFGAVLVGRLLAERVMQARLEPALAAVGVCYALILGASAVQPAVPAENADLTAWLTAHHLTGGLGGYWQGNSVTLNSGGAIELRPVGRQGDRLGAPGGWEIKHTWYDPQQHYANFLVSVSSPLSESWFATKSAALNTFGPPAHTYVHGRYTVMVWNENLLAHFG
jgi:hypothetical protein